MMDNHNNDLITFYLDGNSIAATSRQFNMSTYMVKKYLTEHNIQTRSRSEQCVLENQRRGYKINHNYFDELDNEKVYWLGFLAADGTVRKDNNNIKIGLAKQDEDILIKLKDCLQSESPILYYTTNSGHEVVEFKFSSKQIKEQLGLYSIVPSKTYIGITMQNIPNEYKWAFIKGFYDGDGSYTAGKVKITSLLSGILEEIQNFISQKSYIYHTDRNLYSLELSTLPSLEFLETIYQIDTPYLQRKYNKFLEAKRI